MLHIGTPAANLLQALGIQIGNLPINGQQSQPDRNTVNFSVAALNRLPLTARVERDNLYNSGWPLRSQQPGRYRRGRQQSPLLGGHQP